MREWSKRPKCIEGRFVTKLSSLKMFFRLVSEPPYSVPLWLPRFLTRTFPLCPWQAQRRVWVFGCLRVLFHLSVRTCAVGIPFAGSRHNWIAFGAISDGLLFTGLRVFDRFGELLITLCHQRQISTMTSTQITYFGNSELEMYNSCIPKDNKDFWNSFISHVPLNKHDQRSCSLCPTLAFLV